MFHPRERKRLEKDAGLAVTGCGIFTKGLITMSNRSDVGSNLFVIGSLGAARELKPLAVWHKELFGGIIFSQYSCDTNLYTFEEAYERLMGGN